METEGVRSRCTAATPGRALYLTHRRPGSYGLQYLGELSPSRGVLLRDEHSAGRLDSRVDLGAQPGIGVTGRGRGACGRRYGWVPNSVQDYIAEDIAEPWPGITSQPNADARLLGGMIEMWFGDEQDPALRLRPISLL